MKNPKLIIELTHNGAIIEIKDHADFNEGIPIKLVYEFDEDDKEGLLNLLWQVDEFLICDEGKYSQQRAHIELIHGENIDCKDKDCKICKGEYK